jgi:hypothetical protein
MALSLAGARRLLLPSLDRISTKRLSCRASRSRLGPECGLSKLRLRNSAGGYQAVSAGSERAYPCLAGQVRHVQPIVAHTQSEVLSAP